MTTDASPHRSEVCLVTFDPSVGREIQKTRPAVVVGNDAANAVLNRVQVDRLLIHVHRLHPAKAYVSLDGSRRNAMADRLTTAVKRRLLRRRGGLVKEDVEAVNRVIRVQLDV